MPNTRGFALIVVLWFLVLIAAMSTYLIANARFETAIARNLLAAASAEALADSGIAQAVFDQTDAVEASRWPLDGAPHTIRLPDGDVTIRLFDERQKVNPNRAAESLLAALFEAAGVERALSRRIGASITDWVDRDAEARPLGAERDQYAAAGRSYAPPNAPIDHLDELQLVLGVTPQIYASVRPYLSILTDTVRPDGVMAPAVVQRALRLDPQQTARTDAPAVPVASPLEDELLTADQRAAVEAQMEQAEAATPAEGAADASDTPVIGLDVIARSSNGGVFVRHAVLRLDRSPKGYVVLDWRRGDLGLSD